MQLCRITRIINKEIRTFWNYIKKNSYFFKYTKKPFPLTPSKKYTMIEEFKNEIKGLKSIFTEIKKLELLREQEMNEMKSYM